MKIKKFLGERFVFENGIDKKFESIWIDNHVNKNYKADKYLSDSDYILYNVWRQFNDEWLYKKYLPKVKVISGSMGRTDKIIFHGGCLSCISQQIHGVKRCTSCQYFRADWERKDLSISSDSEKPEIKNS